MNAPMGLIYELAQEYLDGGGDPGSEEQIKDFAIACGISGLEIDPGDLNSSSTVVGIERTG